MEYYKAGRSFIEGSKTTSKQFDEGGQATVDRESEGDDAAMWSG